MRERKSFTNKSTTIDRGRRLSAKRQIGVETMEFKTSNNPGGSTS